MNFVVAIPARLGSTRLPEKPLRVIAGRPMIAHVVERAREAGASDVVVATDDRRIADLVDALGVRAVMTDPGHASGTDRLAEVARTLAWPPDRVVVNLQGDEPLAPPSGIRAVAALVAEGNAPMATLATPVGSREQFLDPNAVKVVRRADGTALYFSRAPIPWARDAGGYADGAALRHIGIYGYRAGFLETFVRLPKSALETLESLEQLRVLEAGHPIAVGIAPEAFPAGVDTPEDLERVDTILARGIIGR